MRKLKKDKKAILGLETVRVVIVTLLILAVISIAAFLAITSLQIPVDTIDTRSITVTNETGGHVNTTGYTLSNSTVFGFNNPAITAARNATSGGVIGSGNYSLSSAGIVSGVNTSRVVTGEITAYINATGYTVAGASTTGANTFVLTNLTNLTDASSIGLGNATISSAGVITNATVTNWLENVSVDYTYAAPSSFSDVQFYYTYGSLGDASQSTTRISGNMSSGTAGFFANVPTFMILLGVIVLLLIIAIVLVVIGRFGGTSEVRSSGSELTGGGSL